MALTGRAVALAELSGDAVPMLAREMAARPTTTGVLT
jgi:hypothetical protein